MNKWIIFAAVCVAGLVEAAPKTPMTKAEYVDYVKTRYEAKGWNFKQHKAEAVFAQMDANKDGTASAAEQDAYWAKKDAEKKEAAKK